MADAEGVSIRADGRPSLLLSYAHEEISPRQSERVIFKTDHFIALVPFCKDVLVTEASPSSQGHDVFRGYLAFRDHDHSL